MVETQDKDLLVYQIENEPSAKASFEKPLLSVLLPVYNEGDSIKEVVMSYYEEIVTKLPSRLIVAEDGSTDQTLKILNCLYKAIPMTLFSNRTRKGFAKGVSDALKRCSGEWVFFSDSDGQYSPSDFWKLWEKRHGYDMIIGHKVHRSEGIHRIVLSKVFHGLVNRVFGLRLHDGDCGFRLIRKEVIQSVVDETRILKYSFLIEFTTRAFLKGYRICEVPINHAPRSNGTTHIYAPSKIPLIVLTQLIGMAKLYADIRRIRQIQG